MQEAKTLLDAKYRRADQFIGALAAEARKVAGARLYLLVLSARCGYLPQTAP